MSAVNVLFDVRDTVVRTTPRRLCKEVARARTHTVYDICGVLELSPKKNHDFEIVSVVCQILQ